MRFEHSDRERPSRICVSRPWGSRFSGLAQSSEFDEAASVRISSCWSPSISARKPLPHPVAGLEQGRPLLPIERMDKRRVRPVAPDGVEPVGVKTSQKAGIGMSLGKSWDPTPPAAHALLLGLENIHQVEWKPTYRTEFRRGFPFPPSIVVLRNAQYDLARNDAGFEVDAKRPGDLNSLFPQWAAR